MATTDEVEAIRERRAKISPAPWHHVGPTDNEERRGEPRQYVTRTVGCGDVPPEKFFITILNCGNDVQRDIADAAFIANAPTDIDTLLSLYDQLRAENKQLQWERDSAKESEEATLEAGMEQSRQFSAEVTRLSSEVGEVWEKAIAVARQPINTLGWGSASGAVAQQIIVESLIARDAAQKKG